MGRCLATASWGCIAASRRAITAVCTCCTTVAEDSASAVAMKTTEEVAKATVEQTVSTEDTVAVTVTGSNTCTRIAANGDWNFFADNLWHASGVGVRNTGLDALRYLDGIAVGHWLADGVRNNLGSAFLDNLASGVGVRNALLFANPVANGVANVLDALLANRAASGVVNRLLTAFWNQSAGCVGTYLASWLADPVANGVGDVLGTALWNHLASGVSDGLLTALRNQFADVVGDRLLAALRNTLGHGVWNNLGQAFLFVSYAINGLFFAGWNPNLLANCFRWALNAFNAALTWAVNVLAGCGIEGPSTWFANSSANDRTCNFFFNRLPASTTDGDRLGVVDRLGNRVVDRTFTSLGYRNHDCVVDHLFTGFHDLVHHGVVDDLFVGFTNWIHHRVVDGLGTGLGNRSANRVVDYLFVGFTNWHHHGVVNDLAVRLIHWARDVIRHLLGTSLIHRSANRIVTNPIVGFTYRYIDRVGNFTLMGFALVTDALDLLVLVNDLVDRFGSGNRLWLVYDFLNRLHYGVCRWSTRIHNITSAIFVADRAAKSSVCSPSAQCGRKTHQCWQSKLLLHSSILPRTFAVPRRTLVSIEATLCYFVTPLLRDFGLFRPRSHRVTSL